MTFISSIVCATDKQRLYARDGLGEVVDDTGMLGIFTVCLKNAQEIRHPPIGSGWADQIKLGSEQS